MIQLNIDGYDIDLYDLDPPKLNFTIEDIRDTSARSIFSRTFRVPATARNTELFTTAFDINGVDFDVRLNRPARISVNGILFRTGQARLNKIYESREGARIDYELIFLGETKDFGTSVGEGYLNELVLTNYDHAPTIPNVELSWQAYPEGSITDGLFEGDIIYPLIDFGVNYSANGVPIETQIAQGTFGADFFTQSGNPLPVERFKPMVRAKVIWDAIFNEAGYTYTSNFINSNRFKQMYLSAFGNTPSIETTPARNTFRARLQTESFESPVPYNILDFDYGDNYDLNTYTYTCPESGSYTIAWNVLVAVRTDDFVGGGINAYLRVNQTNVQIDSDTCPAFGQCSLYLNGIYTANLNAGDTIKVFVNDFGGVDQVSLVEGKLEVLVAPSSEISISPLLDNEYKKIDFIKDILTKFRLVMVPNKNLVGDFIIEPWSEYIGSGDLFDWTKKLDLTKDVITEPLFYTQSSRILYEDKKGEDFLNKLNQETFDEVFGKLIVNGDNEFLTGERKIGTGIIPTPITQIRRQNTNIGDTFIIPQIHAHEPGEDISYNPKNIPIRTGSRLLFYNGLKDTDGVNWYIQNSNNNPYNDYPMVSFYEDFVNTNNTLNLNWQVETGYIDNNINNGLLGRSVYDEYWSGYINSLYDGFSRKVIAYFILDDVDLLDFSFDDVIKVKNTYYYVSKITDAIIGKKSSVKVELIKLNNYLVPLEPRPPRRIWNETNILWNNAAFRWDL